jgi:uncharacterized protein YfaS (alpha-2-macroglobulin family)
VPGAVVTLADQSGGQVGRTRTDDEGRYRLTPATGGTFLVIVAAEHTSPAAALVPVADRGVVHDVTLAGRSAITGRVLSSGPDGDAAVPGTLITLTDVTGNVVGATRSDADGTYSFGDLAGGNYVLTAQVAARRPLARALEVPDAGALAVDLCLPRGGSLTGTVLAASDARPVREAVVTLVDGEGQVLGRVDTAEDGSYAFDDLAEGTYTVTAAGYSPVATSADVVEGARTTVEVSLGAAGDPRAAARTTTDHR